MDSNQSKNENAFKITGNWEDVSRKLKTAYPQLTDTDLKFEPGKEHELLAKIESRLSKKREDVINIIKQNQTAKA